MPQFESLVNESEFISDHYLTSDEAKQTFLAQVRAQRRQWNTDRKEDLETPVSRFSAARLELLSQLSSLTGDLELAAASGTTQSGHHVSSGMHGIYEQLRTVLGYRGGLSSLAMPRGQDLLGLEGVWFEPKPGTEDPAMVIIPAEPAATLDDALSSAKPLDAATYGDKPQRDWSVSKTVSEIFQVEEPPAYVLIMAGRYLILAERARWAEGRYLAMDIQLVAERNETKQGGEIDYFLSIFGSQALLPEADGSIWWTEILDESVSHAVAVSEDLREGIRRSIELIANDVLDRHREQGLGIDDVEGNVLARQAMRYLYRILFLLYAEASPELKVLPVGSEEYDTGYGLDRLRELISQELNDVQAERGTHFYESLDLLFNLVNGSHQIYGNGNGTKPAQVEEDGLVFQPLRADLFEPAATSLIDRVKLSNRALYEVLTRLLLSSEEAGVQRGYVSYATLGVNQLGAVYEGLMSYTGFIAEEPLHEVAPGGDERKGSWVVPVHRSDGISTDDFVTVTDPETGKTKPIVHPKGSFVYRLAGRERQQSASYYTPEVLTRFVVQQALEELLDQPDQNGNPRRTSAQEILELTVCEPALGSGAFAIEAVRQLAEEYLSRREVELDQRIPAENRPAELQKVKAHIALHQVYGVDLNDTAVELAEISLWLDTMSTDLQAPWFGLRLKQGNSLLGAKRAIYTRGQVERNEHLKSAPLNSPETLEFRKNGIYHFLLPSPGWATASDVKEVRELAGENQKRLRKWRQHITRKLHSEQVNTLVSHSQRVEDLWAIALRRLQIAEEETHRNLDLFGKADASESQSGEVVSREDIEYKLQDPNSAYQRLRLVMDLWSSLWFWPIVPDTSEQPLPPDIESWISALTMLVGTKSATVKKNKEVQGQGDLLAAGSWEDVNDAEYNDRILSGMLPIAEIEAKHPWIITAKRIAARHNFFHWELEFGAVFAKGGFDLQVGNPPWVRPRTDADAILAEYDPWWQLAHKPTQAERRKKRQEALLLPGAMALFITEISINPVIASWLSSTTEYPEIAGLQPDLYRAFMAKTWSVARFSGVIGLVHPVTHFTEMRAKSLRSSTYHRLRRHWHFVNALGLYEVDSRVHYGVHIYGSSRPQPDFLMASSIYHPDTVADSLKHDGTGPIPGLRDEDHNWDARPHKYRIQQVTSQVLETWKSVLEKPDTRTDQTRMIFLPNTVNTSVLHKTVAMPRIRELGWQSSSGWHESNARRKGYFEVGSGTPNSWDEVILQGPHFNVATPLAKQPRPSMRSSADYDEIDLEFLSENFIPRTNYQPIISQSYNEDYTRWEYLGDKRSARDFYRLAWRYMANTDNARTLIPTVIPPGTAHVNTVYTVGPVASSGQLLLYAGLLSALPYDFLVRLIGTNLTLERISQLPRFTNESESLARRIISNSARLNCLTEDFAPLWNEVMAKPWNAQSPARLPGERRRLLLELDVLAGMNIGLELEELITLYSSQFPVFRNYETHDLYDKHQRKVPSEISREYRKTGEKLSKEKRLWTHPQSGVEYHFEFPFVSLEREQDYRDAWNKFEKELG